MKIQTVTVVGANGAMGAAVAGVIAAFGNARVYLVSRSYEKSEKAKERAIASVRSDAIASRLFPVDMDELPRCVQESQWVFESVREDYSTKSEIYHTIAANRKPGTLVSTGTSGLSIEKLSESFDEEGRRLFFGTHFFNPPYNLLLCEFTKTSCCNETAAEEFSNYLSETLNRRLIVTRDAPAFLGNRIGFIFLNEAAQFAELYQDRGGIDYIDAILGPFTGRSMPPLRTIDFVGLDIHKAIMDNLYDHTQGFYHEQMRLPDYITRLIEEKRLGRKSGQGFFRTKIDENGAKQLQVYDIATGSYRARERYSFDFAERAVACLEEADYKGAVEQILSSESKHAKICRYFLVKYVACALESGVDICGDTDCADIAMAYGFGWAPPQAMLELMGGVDAVCEMICRDDRLKSSVNVERFRQAGKQAKPCGLDYRKYFKAKL